MGVARAAFMEKIQNLARDGKAEEAKEPKDKEAVDAKDEKEDKDKIDAKAKADIEVKAEKEAKDAKEAKEKADKEKEAKDKEAIDAKAKADKAEKEAKEAKAKADKEQADKEKAEKAAEKAKDSEKTGKTRKKEAKEELPETEERTETDEEVEPKRSHKKKGKRKKGKGGKKKPAVTASRKSARCELMADKRVKQQEERLQKEQEAACKEEEAKEKRRARQAAGKVKQQQTALDSALAARLSALETGMLKAQQAEKATQERALVSDSAVKTKAEATKKRPRGETRMELFQNFKKRCLTVDPHLPSSVVSYDWERLCSTTPNGLVSSATIADWFDESAEQKSDKVSEPVDGVTSDLSDLLVPLEGKVKALAASALTVGKKSEGILPGNQAETSQLKQDLFQAREKLTMQKRVTNYLLGQNLLNSLF